jgi:hypothetical protein
MLATLGYALPQSNVWVHHAADMKATNYQHNQHGSAGGLLVPSHTSHPLTPQSLSGTHWAWLILCVHAVWVVGNQSKLQLCGNASEHCIAEYPSLTLRHLVAQQSMLESRCMIKFKHYVTTH